MSNDEPLALLRAAVSSCEEAAVPYAVIGAVARNAWAPPRATTDVDLTIVVDPSSYERLLAALAGRGIRVTRTHSATAESTPDVVMLRSASGVVRRLDLLVAKTPFEREAVQCAVVRDVGHPCRIVRPEHLVVYKLIAGRPRDLADAAEVLRTRALAGETVDHELIERWAAEWGVDERLRRLRTDLETSMD